MSISPLQRSLFQLTARQSRLAREAQLHAPIPGARLRGKRRKAWKRERNSRRSGQALLLAVLLMVFAALLGSTFITVVSLNLNQTARQQNLGSAQAAVDAGLTFVNEKLNNSALGERWRPFMTTPPPSAITDPVGFSNYYSAFDRAQGWTNNFDTTPPNNSDLNRNGIIYSAATGSEKQEEEWLFIDQQLRDYPTKHLFVKFPDPRGAAVQTGTPQFLAELRPNADGTVHLDVIGQSADDESVFVRETRAKPGSRQNPLVAVARTVTNWDFANNVVPSATVNTNTTTATVEIRNVRGILPPAPFYVTVSDLNTRLDSALVTTVVPNAPGATLTVSKPITAQQGDFVQVAAALGTPNAVDYDADGAATFGGDSNPGVERDNLRTFGREAVAYTPDIAKPASILVNGGLAWMGNVLPRQLGVAGSFVRASGLFVNRRQGVNPAYAQALGINGSALPANLLSSNNTEFPFVSSAVPSQTDRLKIVNDGYDRLKGSVSGQRDADSIKPPDVSSGGSFARYLNLTKYSPSVPSIAAGQPSAALFGYGEGIYIDNTDDKEKFSVPTKQWQPMDDTHFKRMLFSTEANTAVNDDASSSRLAQPYGVTQPTGTTPTSLEQKHLRGWIGPDEFRARGVLVELDPAYFDVATGQHGRVIITRDDLSDNVTNPATPSDTKKAWRNQDGTLSQSFRKVLPWPANGVIYAEGNVRVKGGAFDPATGGAFNPPNPAIHDPGRSITIVSGHNIYIEGSVNAGSRKVVLLAKKNVLVNPTALVQRETAQTNVLSRSGKVLTVPEGDGLLFQPGDWVRMVSTVHRVVTSTTNTVTVDTAFTPATGIISACSDPTLVGTGAKVPYYNTATRVGLFLDVVQRRFRLTPGSNAMRVIFNHSAEQKYAVQLKATNGTPPQTAIKVSNKIPPIGSPPSTDPLSTLSGSKLLQVEPDVGNETYPDPANPPKMADFTLPTLPTTNFSLDKVIGDMLNAHPDPAVPGDWSYDASSSVINNYKLGPMVTKQPLFFFLAAFNNRHSFVPPTGQTLNRGEDMLNPTAPATTVQIPMGTSVSVFSNPVAANPLLPTPLMSVRSNGGASVTESVNQFGFSPQYDQPEDALTGDASFYTYSPTAGAAPSPKLGNTAPLKYDLVNSTLDARNIAVNTPATDGTSIVSLRLNNSAVGMGGTNAGTVANYFDAGEGPIPYYRLHGMKMEGLSTGVASVTDTYNATTGEYQHLLPALTMDIHAFVYAQDGSWLVIPGGDFDPTVATDSTTDPANPTPQRTLVDGNKVKVDLNRDGVISREEKLAAYRMRRYNYQVSFTGAIMENRTAPVSNEGVPNIASVSDWMDKWATFNLDSTQNVFDDTKEAGLKTDGTLVSQASYIATYPPTVPGTPATFGSISYSFDNDLMTNLTVVNVETDSGLRLPVLPDLLPG